MKWNYLKGSEKDFEGAPEWASITYNYFDSIFFTNGFGFGCKIMCKSGGAETTRSATVYEMKNHKIIAQRQPISTPKYMMIFGDPKSFILAHEEATHAAKNKVTGEVVHTHIPGLINLSKFDFIAQRQLNEVSEQDLNECIGASEAAGLPEVNVKVGEIHFNGYENHAPLGGDSKLKLSGHFEGNGYAARLESKHLNVEIVNGVIGITYSAGVFSASEISEATECIKKLNEIVNKSSMEVAE